MTGRFESMLATAIGLGTASDDAAARVASWRQIVDIVAQSGRVLDPETRRAAFRRLFELRDAVPANERRLAANSLASRTGDPDIVRLFATDVPGVAAPMLARVELDEAGWGAAIPAMPAASRNILRNRRDLPPRAVALLAHFAPGDLALPSSPEAESVQPTSGVTPIRELVDRIAAYRERTPQPTVGERVDEVAPVAAFTFETTIDGTIDWIEGAPRAALVGLTIGEMAAFGRAGVDGQAAGAFRRRAPFRDARLSVSGSGEAGGDWLICGAPLFNPRDGRFTGYRGDARRPQPGERVDGTSGGVAPDSLRQLVHELRTPLNAIHGFAEMIDQQLLGPAAARYRERARAIIGDAERLTAMVDDLDTMARLESGRAAEEAVQQPDISAIVAGVVAAHRATLAARGVELALTGPRVPLRAETAASPAERMIARLLAATAGVATPGETVAVDLSGGSLVSVAMSRPLALAGRDERTLLDPGYGPDGDWPEAPLLGLGFTLRLVARLAAQAGGALGIRDDRFVLTLPGVAGDREAMVGPVGFEPTT